MLTAEQLTAALKDTWRDNLISVILYGSAVVGESPREYSDVNILVVVKDAGVSALQAIVPHVRTWRRQGNPAPVIWTQEGLQNARDVFAIEFSDIKANHRILFGEDLFSPMQIDPEFLRRQLEFELRSKLLLLRQKYFETAENPRALRDLLARAFSSLTVLAKTILRLTGQSVPAAKREVWEAIAGRLPVDITVIGTVLDLREGKKSARKADVAELYGGVLSLAAVLVEFIDGFNDRTYGGKK